MTFTVRLTALGAMALALTAVGAAPAISAAASAAASAATGYGRTGSVFVQTDNLSGNAVAAYRRTADGRLEPAGTYPTGGLGGVLAGSAVNHLASQGSLAYDRARGRLYAVNAGSNTITVFAVHGGRLTGRQVISSGGAFPVSVAVRGDLVYVLNARDGGSIQGYRLAAGRLALIPAWHRSLGLGTAASPEFTHTPGEISFTPDGSKLVLTTKAAGNSIEVFPLGPGGWAGRPVVNAEPGAVPFGMTFDAQGRLAVAEAGPNAVVTFTVQGDGRLSPVAQAVTGQAGTCWISGTGPLLYASNAGSASLSGYRDGPGALSPEKMTNDPPRFIRGARCLASMSGPITLVSKDSRIASRSRSAMRPRARAEAVETTWSTGPSRSPRAAMDASSVRSAVSVLISGSPA